MQELANRFELQKKSDGNKTILVVEDDLDLLDFASDVLCRLGYQVLKASDASEALKYLQEGVHLDLIFTDIRLPGRKNGVELVQTALAQQPHLKILLTTGFDEYFLKSVNTPKFPCISKPYYPCELGKTVQTLLDNSGLPD